MPSVHWGSSPSPPPVLNLLSLTVRLHISNAQPSCSQPEHLWHLLRSSSYCLPGKTSLMGAILAATDTGAKLQVTRPSSRSCTWVEMQKILSSLTILQDCLALGAIFAATDTVAVLQVIRPEEAGVLYSLVFGEGVMNDATSVALLRAVQVCALFVRQREPLLPNKPFSD